VERLSAADVMQLITDVGPAPMQIGACLPLGAASGFGAQARTRCLRGAHPKQVEGEMPI
jgi:hypothetical protein